MYVSQPQGRNVAVVPDESLQADPASHPFAKFEAKRRAFVDPSYLELPPGAVISNPEAGGPTALYGTAPAAAKRALAPYELGFELAPLADPYFGCSSPYEFDAEAYPCVGAKLGGRPKPSLTRPLRVIHVGSCMVQGGIEQWLQGLIRFANPQRLKFVRCLVTSQYVDPRLAKQLGVPLEIGCQREGVLRACRDCDVLLVSDPAGVHQWISEAPPPLCVMVAHGDGHWTAQRLGWIRPAADHFVAVSEQVKSNVCEGLPSTVIRNGIDASRLSRSLSREQSRARFGFGAEDFVLGWMGRFSEEKNPFAMINALATMPKHFKLLMVGYGHLRAELMDAANESIPGRYAFVRKDEFLGDAYGAMDAFCLTSFTEGFGLVILEAMMSGLPVITTPVGLAAEAFVDRVNGLIVDGEPESLRDAALLLDRYPDHRRAIGQAAFEFADRTGHASQMAQAYEDLLWKLWAEKTGHSHAPHPHRPRA